MRPIAGAVFGLAELTGLISADPARGERIKSADSLYVTSVDSTRIETLKNEISQDFTMTGEWNEQVAEYVSGLSFQLDELIQEASLSMPIADQGGKFYLQDGAGNNLIEIEPKPGVSVDIEDQLTFQVFEQTEIENVIESRFEFFIKKERGLTEVPLSNYVRSADASKELFLRTFEDDFQPLIATEKTQLQALIGEAREVPNEVNDELAETLERIIEEGLSAEASAKIVLQKLVDAAEAQTTLFASPRGTIIWWYPPAEGAEVPDGWAIADGRTVTLASGEKMQTPNLIDRGAIGGRANVAGNIVGEDEITISENTEGTALSVRQMPSHSHEMVYNKLHNPGWLDLGGDTLDMRMRYDADANETTATKNRGESQKHDHLLNLTFDNRSASVLLVPLIKL